MKPTVSVIIATHDRPDCLLRAVRSVLAQSRLPEELIIINDGEEDLSDEVVEAVRAVGVKFICVRQDYPSKTASRNRGVDLAGGDVVQHLDDDATLPREYIERLGDLYAADRKGVVAGIGASVVEPGSDRLARRCWKIVSKAFGRVSWTLRHCAARYISLPVSLRGRIVPAARLAGGAMSLRRDVAMEEKFDTGFSGYALGEDVELCFRISRRRGLFFASELEVFHTPTDPGRPDMKARGRMYVANSTSIVRRGEDAAAGTYLLLGVDFLGMVVQYATWSLLARRRDNMLLAAGVVEELLSQLRKATLNLLCGS